MAKLYEQLQIALSSYEERPVTVITKQKIDEGLFIIRGTDQGCAAWHYILVPLNKIADLKGQASNTTIDMTKFGSIIKYCNNKKKIMPMSGWGIDPPKMIESWINDHYGVVSVDESINLIYEQDDIRLCTMQRAIPHQLLGFTRYYHRAERFHYLKLIEDLQSTLVIRAGIKNYDRVISFNGFNIENETTGQIDQRIDSQRHLPVQLLVCSPATYAYYKQNSKSLHSDLPTVQRLKPVYATSTSDSNTDIPVISFNNEIFCAVRWENSDFVSIVPQSTVFKSPEFTRVNDICFVEVEEQYRKGKIIFIGSYSDCENSKEISMMQTHNTTQNFIPDCIDLSLKPISLSDSITMHPTLEQLPNELFLYLFTFLNIQHLYNAFWGLNTRLNTLFQSYQNLSLTFDENTDQLSMKLYAPYITRLTVDTSNHCDFTLFPNLQILILCDGNSEHLKQIRPDIIPNLSYLSFLLGFKFIPSSELVNDVFSNRFRFLRHANLGQVNDITNYTWSAAPSLHFVSIRCDKPLIVSCILATCPNLAHLQLHIFSKIDINAYSSPPLDHPLRRLTVWSDSVELSSTDIDTLLTNTPNVEHFYLQTTCCVPFINLADVVVHRLNHLSHFDCYVKEMMSKDSRIGDVTSLHTIHWCFNRIKCEEEKDDFRIFATE